MRGGMGRKVVTEFERGVGRKVRTEFSEMVWFSEHLQYIVV